MGIFYVVTAIKPYSAKELSRFYGVSDRTLMKWLKPFAKRIGKKHGWYYTVVQVETIFDCLGKPYHLQD